MKKPAGDDGTILLLVLGFAAVLLVLVAVVADISAVILAKRGAASAADGAAIAAAQQLDTGVAYEKGIDAAIPLSPDLVREIVAAYGARAATAQQGLQLTADLDPAQTTATIVATRKLTLPFTGWLGVGSVTVTAVAHARAPLVAP